MVCGGLMEIQTPTPIWMKFLPTSPRRFWCRFDPNSIPLSLGGGLKHKNMKETFLKTVCKSKDVQQVAN